VADGDCPVRRSNQVHGRRTCPHSQKVPDSAFSGDRFSIGRRQEDLSAAKIEEGTTGWVSQRGGCHSPPGNTVARHAHGVGFLEGPGREDETMPVAEGIHLDR
jgi:hypothetical protein